VVPFSVVRELFLVQWFGSCALFRGSEAVPCSEVWDRYVLFLGPEAVPRSEVWELCSVKRY
jgi:hypothetical protein